MERTDERPPEVDVVVPCWGSYSATLGACVRSVAGAGLDARVVVVGDDAAGEVARRVGATFVAMERPATLGRCRAQGQRTGQAPLVCFLDADDQLPPGSLQRLRSMLEAHPEAVAATGRMVRRGGTGHWPPRWRARVACTRFGAPVLLWKNSLATVGACLLRRTAVEDVDLFPDLADEDWHAAITVRTAGRVLFADFPALDYAVDEGSLSRRHRDLADLEASQDALLATALRSLARDRWWWRFVERFAAVARRRGRARVVRRWSDVPGR